METKTVSCARNSQRREIAIDNSRAEHKFSASLAKEDAMSQSKSKSKSKYASHFQRNVTPQRESAREDQVKNRAGGFVFKASSWMQLDRFLVLGAEGNTYYSTERELTRDNAKNVLACLKADGVKTVARIAEISFAGRAPKNDPAIFALALAATDETEATRAAAYAAVNQVCRTGTHLFQFLSTYAALHGGKIGGAGIQKAIARWYVGKKPDALAMQVLKYQNRESWSHRDALRLAHGNGIKELSAEHAAIFEWIRTGGDEDKGFSKRIFARKGHGRVEYAAADRSKLPALLDAYAEMKATTNVARAINLIVDHGFTREMIPTALLNSPDIRQALLLPNETSKFGMPMTAMIRNLGKMSAVGLIKPFGEASKFISKRLQDPISLRHARVHPIQLLSAARVYAQGHGEKGKLTWTADQRIVDALDEGFYAAFHSIEPTGQNWLLALDVSGSMASGNIAGVPGLTPREASAVMAMVTARTEDNWHCVGFTQASHGRAGGKWSGGSPSLTDVKISPKMRLRDVLKVTSELPMGGTDCALPMLYASGDNLDVDVFCVITDNETWAGSIHPFQALCAYRAKSGKSNSKLIVMGMTATDFTIADPTDPGMLDVVGMDAATPAIMADFARSSMSPG
jgi:60 kDa SS-A/Ro ribonucleoprotein